MLYGVDMSDLRHADVSVEPLVRARHSETIAVLARAFWPDPLFGFFSRDLLAEHHQLPKVFAAFLADAAPFDGSFVARAGDRIVGAAVWVPPGSMPRSKGREAKLQARVARLLVTGCNRRKGLELLTAVDDVHPHEDHWYLNLLGTDPLMQGRGIGGSLLGPTLDRADADGVPAYLETQKESNLAFYGRYGFAIHEEIRIEGAPPVWTMWRDAR